MEASGLRVGVRWEPPALVYVYQSGQVLRLARIPLRNLEDEDIADRVYKKHEDNLLKGLEKRHVERMVNILRHHHGLDSARKTDGHSECTSECPTEDGASLSRSQVNPSQTSRQCSKNEKEEPVKRGLSELGKSWNPAGRLSRGGDVLLLLDEASRKREESDKAEKPLERKRTLEKLPKITVDVIKSESKPDPTTIKMEKIDKTLQGNFKDSARKSEGKDNSGQQREEKPKKRESVEDNSEDTDLDLEDLEIPLDPVQNSENDDFWS